MLFALPTFTELLYVCFMFCSRQESTQKLNHNLTVLIETTFQAHAKSCHLLSVRQSKKHFIFLKFHN